MLQTADQVVPVLLVSLHQESSMFTPRGARDGVTRSMMPCKTKTTERREIETLPSATSHITQNQWGCVEKTHTDPLAASAISETMVQTRPLCSKADFSQGTDPWNSPCC